jgi:hypothetical protein
MGKKLTTEFVKEEYKKHDCEFLDNEYVNKKYKHKIKCNNNHIFYQSYGSSKSHNCPKCAIIKKNNKRKYNLEFIKKEYLKKNCKFLDKKYINSKYKHNIKCLKCNYIWKQEYNHFQQGQGCPKCVGNIKHTLDFVKEQYQKRGYEFLDKEYVNGQFKHNIKCDKGHIWKQSYSSFTQKRGCPKCAIEERANKKRHSLDFIKNQYQKRNYEFLDPEYNGSNFKHNIKCLKCGYIFLQLYRDFTQLHGCPKCANQKRKQNNPFKNKEIQKNIRQTCFKKYGVKFIMQNRDIALKSAKSSNHPELHYHWLTGEEVWTQGSYEANTIHYLTINRINYLWQPKTFMLSTNKTYRPDLYLVNEDKWVEIKGYFHKDALEKWNEFHNIIHPNSELWDKRNLKK